MAYEKDIDQKLNDMKGGKKALKRKFKNMKFVFNNWAQIIHFYQYAHLITKLLFLGLKKNIINIGKAAKLGSFSQPEPDISDTINPRVVKNETVVVPRGIFSNIIRKELEITEVNRSTPYPSILISRSTKPDTDSIKLEMISQIKQKGAN